MRREVIKSPLIDKILFCDPCWIIKKSDPSINLAIFTRVGQGIGQHQEGST